MSYDLFLCSLTFPKLSKRIEKAQGWIEYGRLTKSVDPDYWEKQLQEARDEMRIRQAMREKI